LLPAGFEIESVVNEETVKSFPFLAKITPTRISEARDDRFFAAFDLGQRPYRSWWDEDKNYTNSFHVAYVVRAVTPGSFALPAVNVSDMYAPRIYARSDMGRVNVAPRSDAPSPSPCLFDPRRPHAPDGRAARPP